MEDAFLVGISDKDIEDLGKVVSEVIVKARPHKVLGMANVIHSSNMEFNMNAYPAILLRRIFAIAGETVPSELVLPEDHIDIDYPREQFDALLKRAASHLNDGPE